MASAKQLRDAGADLMVSDINSTVTDRAVADLSASVCAVDAVFDQDMDIFAPCALGGILNDDTVERLTGRMVCGAANNQLATPEIAEKLRARGIRYLPDYVVNAGGIISVASEIFQGGDAFRDARLTGLAIRMKDILRISRDTDQSTIRVADQMVAEILDRSSKRKGAA